jgi:peptidoglycan biosynthesis protein MviN/MurJ (putative lipid II flippase)
LISTVVVAHYFGTGRDIEVYLAAVALHASLVGMAQTGQVSEVLIPTYHLLRSGVGRPLAYSAITALCNRLILLLGLAAVLAWVWAPQIAKVRVPGFGTDDIALVATMFRWILPLAVLQVAAELLRALANAERMFGSPEAVGLVAKIAGLLVVVTLGERVGTWALVSALWLAGVAEIVGLLSVLWRQEYRYSLRVKLPDGTDGAGLLSKLLVTLPYMFFTQVFLFSLDAAMSHLAQGTYAVLRYSMMIWARVQGVFLRPVTIPFFTELSEARADASGRWSGVAQSAMASMLAVTAIVTVSMVAGGEAVFSGLLGGDRFPPERIGQLSWLLVGFSLLLPVAGIAAISRKAAVSAGRVGETYLALAGAQVLSAVFVWGVVAQFGLKGALVGHAFNVAACCVGPLLVLRLTGERLSLGASLSRVWRWGVAVGAGGLAGVFIAGLLGEGGSGDLLTRFSAIMKGVLAAASAAIVTVAVSSALKLPESRRLVARLSSLFDAGRPPL